jgi:competence protein ComEA
VRRAPTIVAGAEGLPGPDAQRGSTWQAVAFTFTFNESARPRIRLTRLPARGGQEVVMTRILAAVLVALALLAPSAAAQDSDRAAMKSAPAGPVNLNTATAAQLEALPGIGARTAALIVEYRQKNGGFKKIEDLMNVRGVGEKSFLRLKTLVTVTPPRTDRAVQQ